jgi:hypothetical protein
MEVVPPLAKFMDWRCHVMVFQLMSLLVVPMLIYGGGARGPQAGVAQILVGLLQVRRVRSVTALVLPPVDSIRTPFWPRGKPTICLSFLQDQSHQGPHHRSNETHYRRELCK